MLKCCCICCHGLRGLSALVIADTENDTNLIKVTCAESCGNRLFGIDAYNFHISSDEEKARMVEEVSNVPVITGAIVDYNVDKDDLHIILYDTYVVDQREFAA